MNLKVLTTSREIREYLKNFNNEIIPEVLSIGEFLDKVIIVDNKKFVDDYLRKFYLFKAIENINVEKLGINKEFMSFFKSSEFILGFFNEVYLERVNIEDIRGKDIYAEWDEHLTILEEIYKNYKSLLEKDGFVDRITINDFRINENFLKKFEKIELEVLGYLTKFDLEVLKKVSEILPIEISFIVSKYNKNLIQKMFGDGFDKEGKYIIDFDSKKVLYYQEINKKIDVEVVEFSERINQVNFVLATIEEFVRDGLDIEKIAVILPDEGFGDYLKLFRDDKFNINFAFGESFEKSEFYIKLKALYDYLITKDEISFKKSKEWLEEFKSKNSLEEVLEFLEAKLKNKEKIVAEEEFFKIKKIAKFLENDKEKFLHFLLDRLKNLSFDDTSGGKVTAMGVLESRGVEFDGVIVVDFNEGVVPNRNDKDFFLNSVIRKRVNLPTRADKEALQKNYYYNLFLNAKKVKISYVNNEEVAPSRFLYELNLKEGKNRDYFYSEVLFKFNKNHKRFSYDGRKFEVNSFTPTSLYDLYVCTRRYYFRYILKIANEIEEKENFGNIFHNAIKEVVKANQFNNNEEYFENLMREILKDKNKKEIFDIRSKWEDKIKKFCEIDFKRAKKFKKVEEWGSENLGEFKLSAKFDRLDEEFVIDYKTGEKSKEEISKDYIQALFYNYIFKKPALFYYIKDEKNIEEMVDNENPDNELKKLIDNLEFVVIECEDEKHCKYCEYRFACGRE